MSLILPQRGRIRQKAAAVGGISFIGSATTTTTSSTSIAVDVSSLSAGTLSEDDVIIAVVSISYGGGGRAFGTLTAAGDNSGSATEEDETTAASTRDDHTGAYVLVQGATVDTTVTFTLGGSPSNYQLTCATCMVYRGVDTTTPIDVTTPAFVANTSGSIPDPPSITPITSGAWVVVIGSNATNNGGSETITHASLDDDVILASTGTGQDNRLTIGNYTGWTSGAYDAAAFSYDGSDSAGMAAIGGSIALRPA